MLITFTCEAHENITMFGDDAKRLLTWMGHSGEVPGAILAVDVSEALNQLSQAIEKESIKPLPISKVSAVDEDHEVSVSMVQRAFPLMALLKNAIKHQCNVMWS